MLERLHARSSALAAELANDWEWFKKNRDDARLRCMDAKNRGSWGSQFRDIILNLLYRTTKCESNALAKWMAQEMHQFLAVPKLRI